MVAKERAMHHTESTAIEDEENDTSTAATITTPPLDDKDPKASLLHSFLHACKLIITHSWINVLLVFVPAGIIVKAIPGMHGGVVFALNCVAVIPLAGMLAFATESVAGDMGDALGALINVTFGNSVELIIL